MRSSLLIYAPLLSTLATDVLAWPGMSKIQAELRAKLPYRKRQSSDQFDSNELIGDLATIGAVTPIGRQVKDVILGQLEGYSDETYVIPAAKGSAGCAADKCCIWAYIAADLQRKFRGTSGRCNGLARAAVRQGFHDAGAWSKTSGWGGADGSLILSNEINRPENNGLQNIVSYTQSLYNSYSSYGIGMADLVQFMANTATVVCPLGPRVRTYIGRLDNARPAPDGLLPSVTASANSLIQLFKDKTIKEHGLTALVGAHSTSQQQFVDTSRPFAPQDSTPGIWDVLFYTQTLKPAWQIPSRVFKFQSDIVLSQHPNIASEWNKFAAGDADDWNEDYAREYVRLSLLGVNRINNLTECTKVLPQAIKSRSGWQAPDIRYLTKWANGSYDKLGPHVETAVNISAALLRELGYKETD